MEQYYVLSALHEAIVHKLDFILLLKDIVICMHMHTQGHQMIVTETS